ncbi:uncharacterized protein LOC144563499 isoform X2 [Carex rostrata]
MFEHAEIRFKAREDLNILLEKREVGESSSYHSPMWMGRWTSRTLNNKGAISRSENTKTRVAEQLVIGVNRRTTTSSNLLSTSRNENFDFCFNSLTQKSVVSSNMAACEVLEGSDHFPIYGIKKKIESIINPKGKARFKDKISGLNLTFHSSEEFHFETQFPNPKNHQLTALGSCSCNEEGNFSTSSQINCPRHINETQSRDSADRLRGSSKRKAVSLFEMVTFPKQSYDMARSRRKSNSCQDFEWHGMIDNYRKVEGQVEQSDASPVNSMKALGSVGDLASSRAQKVITCNNSTRPNSTATASPEKSPPTRDNHIGSLNTDPDLGPSRTVTMDAGESLPESSTKQKATVDQEALDNRWLKRLKHNISNNAPMLNPNRLKIESSNPSWVPEQQVKSWLQRWCVKKSVSEGGFEGRRFPSIAAMAMMGKAMNKFRPGEFEKRGPSVVWNNNEF